MEKDISLYKQSIISRHEIIAWTSKLKNSPISAEIILNDIVTEENLIIAKDPFGVGTLTAFEVSLPSKVGITFVTALAAPVELGIIFKSVLLPHLKSFFDGPSTVNCVAVAA